jgi:outer membrane protein OmpA-like peptidoglycan-associated protein
MKSHALLLTAMLAVYGCTSVAPPAPSKPAAPADQRAATPAALTVERQWLQSWFQGTPVLIGQRNDGAVNVDVPREFCFDPGRSSVKPALAAVLDKVAESLRRVPLARLSLLAAPDDATGTAPLALERAVQVQKHLLSRGVPAARLVRPTATSAAAVQLRMEAAPP